MADSILSLAPYWRPPVSGSVVFIRPCVLFLGYRHPIDIHLFQMSGIKRHVDAAQKQRPADHDIAEGA
jgi:hypothetical protein